MPYSQFKTISSVKAAFGVTIQEGDRFLPQTLLPIAPSQLLVEYLRESLPMVATAGSEKARSEGIIYPVLLEVRRYLNRTVSLFSGEGLDVDETQGLTGICDFIISRSAAVLEVEAPVLMLVEAKKTDLKTGFGQCMAELIAAQKFNCDRHQPLSTLYGGVTNGTQWQFMKLEQSTITIDLSVYPLPPVDQLLGFLVWMVEAG